MQLKIIECPRDAMQGWKTRIPAKKKIDYINQLLQVGFDTIDFGSFVSHEAIPQMADTKEVIDQLDMDNTNSKLLAIVANLRGAIEAVEFEKIYYLGFPFSVSSTFQMRNTHSSIEDSLKTVKEIKNICDKNNRELVIYISMAFGNPYGDKYNEGVVLNWIKELVKVGIRIVSLSDTVGVAHPPQISSLVKQVVSAFAGIETGVHLHSTHAEWQQKIDAALQSGCRRFDGAIKGYGGCPMAKDELIGNMDTELIIPYFKQLGILNPIDEDAFRKAGEMAAKIFI
ncbi:MAG: hydroxymethylglutaryl-CoA lyase [Ginsengibacter sp.]